MASHVTTRHFSPFNHSNLHSDSLHKMPQHQYERLLQKMYMPFVRGPEDRHLFPSFIEKCSSSFLKSNPFIPPEDESYILAPHREDEPVISSFSGLLSPAAEAEADQQIPSRKYIELQSSGKDVQPPQETCIPHQRDRITKRRTSFLLENISQNQRWNSRAVPDISLRAKIGGSTSPRKAIPVQPKTKDSFSSHRFAFCVDPDVKLKDPSSETCRDEKARKYMYTSTTQRGYEDIPWDLILLPKIKPPGSVQELRDDGVSQNAALKRYEPTEEISQVVGDLWGRFQKRPFIVPHRPIDFVSPSSRTQQLPLYTGCVGAENVEDLDNPYVEVRMHSRVRCAKPRYVKSSYNPNTFGYAGKVHWLATQPANSNLPPTSPSAVSRMYGILATHGQPTEFPHLGPLSQIITPIQPQNSFNNKQKERITI
nr:protein SPMIP7 [Anolis sagrei ordinatus]